MMNHWSPAGSKKESKFDTFRRQFRRSSAMGLDGSSLGTLDVRNTDIIRVTLDKLKQLYEAKMRPLEFKSLYHDVHSPPLTEADFQSTPTVLVLGQYSTGKTSLIKHILDAEYPGMRIGQEPTTEAFTVIEYGESEYTLPGYTLAVDPRRPYRDMKAQGLDFLNKLKLCAMPNRVLQHITFVDTPGIYSGEKQKYNRGYNFTEAVKWFAEKADLILMLFDVFKLDVSDELREVIQCLKPYEDKMRVLLNKSDRIDEAQLFRVYGTLVLNYGRCLATPEAPKVYVGSFSNFRLQHDHHKKMFESESKLLLAEIEELPRYWHIKKVAETVRRAKMVKTHALIVVLWKFRPQVRAKSLVRVSAQEQLEEIVVQLNREYGIRQGDFPRLDFVAEKLSDCVSNVSFAKHVLIQDIEQLDELLSLDLPALMAQPPPDRNQFLLDRKIKLDSGAFVPASGFDDEIGIERGRDRFYGWVVEKDPDYELWVALFERLQRDDKIRSNDAKRELKKSNFPPAVLAKLYKMADLDCDGCLTLNEWVLMNYLIKLKIWNYEIPDRLPAHLLPPDDNDYCGDNDRGQPRSEAAHLLDPWRSEFRHGTTSSVIRQQQTHSPAMQQHHIEIEMRDGTTQTKIRRKNKWTQTHTSDDVSVVLHQAQSSDTLASSEMDRPTYEPLYDYEMNYNPDYLHQTTGKQIVHDTNLSAFDLDKYTHSERSVAADVAEDEAPGRYEELQIEEVYG